METHSGEKFAERMEFADLYDCYGQLLTDHQREILTMYLYEDLTVSEIGDSKGISRQAVHDMLKRTHESLADYEARLGFIAQRSKEHEQLLSLYDKLSDAKDEKTRKTVLKLLKKYIDSYMESRESNDI
ncbi:MAG: sigma factor-like helix-turn-helix DNA-binding protein [Selenomonadaceae bacterium]|nr:sigma factor-like helix-turn-helix DNA-binding protein [Selenomonadaceae bacterium]